MYYCPACNKLHLIGIESKEGIHCPTCDNLMFKKQKRKKHKVKIQNEKVDYHYWYQQGQYE